jgi:hypothetical protein
MSRALLDTRRTADAATSPSGAEMNAPFVTTKKRVPNHTVTSGLSQTALGDLRLLAALIDRAVALIGKMKTKPTSKLPMK